MERSGPLQIRIAEADDVPAMVLCDDYAQSHESRRWFLQATVAQQQCLAAVRDGSVVDFVVLTHGFFEQGFIPLIVVAETHRRRGIGLQLLRAAESRCRTPRLFASTNSSNVTAQRMLSKAGFVRSGTIENLDAADTEVIYFKRVR